MGNIEKVYAEIEYQSWTFRKRTWETAADRCKQILFKTALPSGIPQTSAHHETAAEI